MDTETKMDERLLLGGHVEKAYEITRQNEQGQEVPVGIVEGYLATWDVDRARDQFLPGSFSASVAELRERGRWLRLKRNHWNLIGGFDPEKLAEDNIGLRGVAEINLGVQEGREAYMLAKQGVLADFSVGVSLRMGDMEEDEATGVRKWKKATLWECSLVDEPMNPGAVATAVRSYFDQHMQTREEAIVAVAEYTKRFNEIDADQRDQIESEINANYREVCGSPSPLERGTWSLEELRALPKSYRRYIIRSRTLSRDAIDAVVDALAPSEEAEDEEPAEDSSQELDELRHLLREPAEAEKQATDAALAELADLLRGVNR